MIKKIAAAVLLLAVLMTAAPFSAAAPVPVTTAISPVWAGASDFSDGLAAVFDGAKWGYIDKTGAVSIPCVYDIAGDFNEGLAAVATVEKGAFGVTPDRETWHLINKDGTVFESLGVNERYYASSPDFVTGVYNGTYIKRSGLDSRGEIVSLRPGQKTFAVKTFANGFAFAEGCITVSTDAAGSGFSLPAAIAAAEAGATPSTRGDMLVTHDGKVLWSSDWGALLGVNRGLVAVHSRSARKWGFATVDGKYVVAPEYDDFSYIVKNGAFVIFNEGLASLKKGGTFYAVDTAGGVLFSKATEALGVCSEGLFSFLQNGVYGYCNLSGGTVVSPQYTAALPFSNGAAAVSTASGWYFIDKTGARLNSSAYQEAHSFSEGLACVKIGGKYGFVSLGGRPADAPGDAPSATWAAAAEIAEADALGFLPYELSSMYRRSITRAEMSKLSVMMLSALSGRSVESYVLHKTGKSLDAWTFEYRFLDSTDRFVVAANALGIVVGQGEGVFNPHSPISRQEAAQLLMKTAQLAGLSSGGAVSFGDMGKVGSWAVPAVNFVSGAGIMSGVGGNQFDPLGSYTREQAIATMRRIFVKAG